MSEPRNIRLGVNMNPETAAALRKIADLNGVTVTEAVRRAIAVAVFVEGETRSGCKVFLEDADGARRELVLM